jgi:uncharacterized membrane protein
MSSPDPKNPDLNTLFFAFFEVKLFTDLLVVFFWLILAMSFIYIPALNDTPFRIIFALPVILFIPGYVLIAALFPGNEEIEIIERIVLSFGLSIVIVPLIGLGLNYTPFGIRLDPIITSLAIFIVVMICIAQYRRALLPVIRRFSFPVHCFITGIREEYMNHARSGTERILSILLFIAIITAMMTTIYIIVVPKQGEKFTEFYILGEKNKAADYPTMLIPGKEYLVYIGVGNHEFRNITYTIETHLLNMTFDRTGNTSIVRQMILINSTSISLPHNQTVVIPFILSASSLGYNRVVFLLFNETIPGGGVSSMDRINQSYRDLHLWVNTYSEK